MRTFFAGAVALALAAGSANATIFTLTFEGLGNLEPVASYYDGGLGGGGSGPGPAFGVQFVGNTLAIRDSDAGGTGNFANEPTGDTIMFFLSGGSTIMNVPAGFNAGFATWYSSIDDSGQIDIYDGLNGTGTLLGSLALVPLGSTPGGGDPNGQYNRWSLVGVPFTGVAKSVVFGGVADRIGFDNVTFGSDVPAPGAAGLALAGVGLLARRRRA